jgi:hypothetical protein
MTIIGYAELWYREVSIDGERRRSVFKHAVVGPLVTQQTVGEEGKPPFVTLNDGVLVRGWLESERLA